MASRNRFSRSAATRVLRPAPGPAAGCTVTTGEYLQPDDLSAKHALLLAGVGWGGMPRAMVDADVQAGRLAILAVPEWGVVAYPFHIIHRIDSPPGPAGRWLIDRFSAQAPPS